MGTHLRVLSESYLMNTNMIGFQISLHFCALDESSLSLLRVKVTQISTSQSYRNSGAKVLYNDTLHATGKLTSKQVN